MSRPADTSNTGPADGRGEARRIVIAQVCITIVTAIGFWIASSRAAAEAALVGGMINVVANGYFARKLYGTRQRGHMPTVAETISRFYVGEFVKVFVTVALLAMAIGVFKLSFLPLFTAFIATLAVFWLALSPRFHRLFGVNS